MRAIVGVSGSLVIMVIIVAVQYSILSDNVRNREVERGIDCAFDYCIDAEFEDAETFMAEFCEILSQCMMTDGELDVYLIESRWDDGYADMIVEETYEYRFFGRKGSNRWERAYKIS